MRLGFRMVVSLRTFLSSFNRLVQAAGQPKFLALWFVLCALPTGLGLIWNTPISEVPDEPGHALRARRMPAYSLILVCCAPAWMN